MSILSAIGNTPLVELNALNRKKTQVRIFRKLEGANPGGSVKDRPAYRMIKKAEKMTCGTIVAILPDRGDRYLSTTLFRSICAKCPP
jgi:cysteine synthase